MRDLYFLAQMSDFTWDMYVKFTLNLRLSDYKTKANWKV